MVCNTCERERVGLLRRKNEGKESQKKNGGGEKKYKLIEGKNLKNVEARGQEEVWEEEGEN
jgi:hypothetical protein